LGIIAGQVGGTAASGVQEHPGAVGNPADLALRATQVRDSSETSACLMNSWDQACCA
jgi:hypothetical protein